MRRIKIVQLINNLRRGGAEAVAADIARSLNREAFDASVWCLRSYRGDRPDFTGRLRKGGLEPVDIGEMRLWRAIPLLTGRLKKERPDILHCHLPLSIIAGTIAGRLAGVPCIVAHHHNTWAFNSWKINLALRLVKPFIHLHICYAGAVEEELFGATHLIDEKIAHRPGRSCTIHSLLDIREIERVRVQTDRVAKRRDLKVEADDFLILTVARLIDWKGTDTAIRAMATVCARIPSARLVIAGEGRERANLEALIRESSARERIHMLGARPDVYELLCTADAFSGVYRYAELVKTKEAVGVAILEAMAAGLPVVVSDYPSARAYVRPRETGMLVTPNDPDALAQALIELAQAPSLHRRVSEGGRSFVQEHLSLEHLIPVYESLYRALV